MPDTVRIAWRGLAAVSTEVCRIAEGSDGVRIEGEVRGEDGVCTYALRSDVGWRFRSLRVEIGERELRLALDGPRWTVDGRPRPDLAEARDPDLSVSPLTNTLPIRRLGLEIGESRDIVTAYVVVPGLEVVPDPQRYTRLSEHEYLYESRDTDFRRTITVDGGGFVVVYPGLFERAPTPSD